MADLRFSIPHELRPFGGDDVLVYCDGPLLFFLPVPERKLLAIALSREVGPWPCLVVELSDELARTMLANEVTLRKVTQTAATAWLMRDYGADVLVLEPLSDIPEDWLPGDVRLYLEEPSR